MTPTNSTKPSWQTTFFGVLAIALGLAGPLTEVWAPKLSGKVTQTTTTIAAVAAGTGLIKAKDQSAQ